MSFNGGKKHIMVKLVPGMEKQFWMVCITHMFIEVYFLIQVSLIPVFIREFQLTFLEASLVATLPSLVQLIMNIPAGLLADQFSTKHLLFASMLLEGTSAILVSQTSDFWTLVLGVSVMRVSSPIYHISGLSGISRIAKQEQMSRSMGFHNALGSLGSAIGGVSLAIFLSTLGWRWIYLFWGVPILVWGTIILRSPQLQVEDSEKTEPSRGGVMPKDLRLILSSGFLIFLLTIGIRQVGMTSTSTFMTTYLVEMRGLSEATASLIFGIGPLTGIVGSLYGGYSGGKFGAKKALSFAMLACIVSLSILAFLSQLYLLTFFFLVYEFFSNSAWSPINTIVANMTPTRGKGLSFSVYFLTEGLTASLTPTAAAMVIELSNAWYIFPFSVISLAASFIMLQFLSYI